MMLDGCTPWPAEFADRYREAGHWRGETFSSLLRSRAVDFGSRVAIVDGDRRWTYAELAETSAKFRTLLLALGIEQDA